MAWVNGVSDLGGGGAGGAVTDPIVPGDGTQNITGALAVSGAITAASVASSGAVSGTTITGSSHISGVNVSSSGAILAAVGTVGAPGISWTTYPATGFYVPSANTMTLALNGVASMTWATGVSAFRQSIGTGTSSGFNVSNTTAAAAGAQQYSPALRLAGTGWATDSGGSSKTAAWYLQTRTIEGAANPTAELHVMQLIDAGTPTSMANFSTLGGLTLTDSIRVGNGTAAAPSMAIASDTDNGFYLVGANTLGLSIAGAKLVQWDTQETLTLDNVSTNMSPVLTLTNNTAATVGAQQYSPAIAFRGSGWKTNATAGAQNVDFAIRVRPVQGAANPAGNLEVMASINGAAASSCMTVNHLGNVASVGTLTSGGALTVSSGGASFTGSITVAGQINGTSILSSVGGVSGTNTLQDLWFPRISTSGTAAAGLGPAIVFRCENAAGTLEQDQVRVGGHWTNAAAGSEATAFAVETRVGGAVPARTLTLSSSASALISQGTASMAHTHTTDTLGLSITTGGSATAGTTLGLANNISTVVASTGTSHGLTLVAVGDVTVGTGSTKSFSISASDASCNTWTRVNASRGSDLASATNLDLGTGGNSFRVTGTTTIQSINTAPWNYGTKVMLYATAAWTLKHNGTTTGNYKAVTTATGADYVMAAGNWVELTMWQSAGGTVQWLAGPLMTNPVL